MTDPHAFAPQPLASRGARKRQLVGLTPLIDVVFILLIFFMLASNLQQWQSIGLNAPMEATGAQADDDRKPVLVDVYADGLEIDGEKMALSEAVSAIEIQLAADAKLAVLVRPAEGVTLQRAVDVLDGISATGATNVSLVNAGAE